MHQQVKKFLTDDTGATALEYGMIAGFISLAVAAGAGVAGPAVKLIFDHIGTTLQTASTSITA